MQLNPFKRGLGKAGRNLYILPGLETIEQSPVEKAKKLPPRVLKRAAYINPSKYTPSAKRYKPAYKLKGVL